MNRLLLLRYRRDVSSLAIGLKWRLYSVYYVYDGGVLIREAIGIPPGQDLTPEELADYPNPPAPGTFMAETVCVDNRVRKFRMRTGVFGDTQPLEIVDTNENCGVSCDLLISSLTKVDATPGAADGSITVVATTSNPVIEYRLRSLTLGQVVADWQLSPVFSGLGLGAYQAFARDSKGCLQDKAIYLPESPPVYGERYRSGYVDRRGRATRVSIYQRGWTGLITERLSLKGGLNIEYDGDTRDKYQAIFGSSATISLYAESRLDFVDLYSSDDRRNRVEIYKDNAIFWKGWLIADYYEDSYVRERGYGVVLKAVDGLGDLKQGYYQTLEKEPYEGFETQMAIIRRCLSVTGLTLGMRTGINVYEVRSAMGANDDPLLQTYVDNRAYHINADDDPLDYYEVLERNLTPYGARLFQSQGRWWILNVNEMKQDMRLRNYDENGVFEIASVYSPVRAIFPPSNTDTPAALYWFGAQQRREMLPGYQLYTLLQDYGLRDNFLPDSEFYNNAFVDRTHLKKWTWDANIAQAGTPPPTGYEGKTDYIPPKSFSGEVIKRKVAKSDPYGLIINGNYMQEDAFGRVLLFKVKEILPFYWNVYWNVKTSQVETVLMNANQASQEGGYVFKNENIGVVAEYKICEGGFVSRFVGIGDFPYAVKEQSPGPVACPVTFGKPAFVRSQKVYVEQFAGQSIHISFTFRINASQRRFGDNAKSAIAKFFKGRIQLTIGNYCYDGEEEEWVLYNPGTEAPKQIYFAAEKINDEDSFELLTVGLPVSGDLQVEIGNLLFDGNRSYFESGSSLYIKDFKLQMYKFEEPYPDSFLLSSVIDRRFTYVPDQVTIYHGDLPPGEKNMPLTYAGGMYLKIISPAQLTFSRTRPGTEVDYTNEFTVLRGSGTSGILGRFSFDSEVYLVRAGNTIDQKEGPYQIKGFASSTNDAIINRPYSDSETITPLTGYIFLSSELTANITPTKSWKRVGPTAIVNEPEQLLLRLALQNRALAHALPSIRLGGTLKGDLGFQHAITDPNMPGKVFVPAYYSYDDNQATVSGDWVEMGEGMAGTIDTNPPPIALHGNLVYENGQLQYFEDQTIQSTEDAI